MRSALQSGAATLGQRPPRLVLRVILFSALTLGLGAATLLVFIRQFERERAEHSAMLEASVVAQAVVDRLQASDLQGHVSRARKDELDRMFAARVLDASTVGSAFAGSDGRLVYATSPRLVGTRLAQSKLSTALHGTLTSTIVSTDVGGKQTKVLRAFAPFRLADGARGVLVVDKNYAQIASAAWRAAITVAAVLELVLLSLWLCLFPIMRSVTRRMNRQLDTIAHQALHDDLTGLANRTQFGARLDEALERESGDAPAELAVFFVDLERFKEVNDALGHDCGNELLTVVAERLENAAGPDELVARLGGDEFGVISLAATDEESAFALADRLQEAMMQPCEIGGVTLEVHGSIGIALSPQHGTGRDDLLRRADMAMYAAKRLGVPQLFTPGLDEHSPLRLAMTGELRRALERCELVVMYQPQLDLRTGTLHGAEALVRWRHPTRGFLGPDAFLTAAEQGGLMRNVTRHVLDESLGQLRGWRDAGLAIDLAVNVAGRDLADARFPDEIAGVLDEHRIDPSWLELEITESVLLSDRVRTSRVLERIVDQGVRIAIDDFGVGYSSLGQLKNLPAHTLKIDRSFVSGMETDPSDEAIVSTTIELAHRLGLDVIAEGVEGPGHLACLQAASCDIGQGHFLGRPLPGAQVVARASALESVVEPARVSEVVPLRRAG